MSTPLARRLRLAAGLMVLGLLAGALGVMGYPHVVAGNAGSALVGVTTGVAIVGQVAAGMGLLVLIANLPLLLTAVPSRTGPGLAHAWGRTVAGGTGRDGRCP